MFVEGSPFLIAVLLVFGLIAGAFATVVVHRDSARVSLFTGPLMCPSCGDPAPWYQRIPVFSYVAGRGKRRACGCAIRVRDPLLELALGVAWAALGARIGLQWILPALLLYAFTLVTVSAVDLDERRIPNKVMAPMSVAGIVLVLLAALMEQRLDVVPQLAIGAAGYAAPLFVLGIAAPGSMGMGDVKLAAYMGLHLAWFSLSHVLVGAILGFIIGALLGLTLIVLGKKGRKDTVPFGPSIALGGLLVLFVGSPAALVSV
ncbi:MAG: A24 family peptidase [Actinomycetota bacterium]